MKDLPRTLNTPSGVDLGPVTSVADGASRSIVLVTRASRFHGFVVRRDDAFYGYVDRCPHAGLPLAQTLDQFIAADGRHIQCSWHGALFEPETGLCVGGPCVGARLQPWPLQIIDGHIFTA